MIEKDIFDEWYHDIVEKADLTDKRYPIKGMNIWRPYGWNIMRRIDTMIRYHLDKTHHEEVCFPLLIPESYFKKEADHIKGFSEEVYWVTHAGDNTLEERYLLRPTSETAIYSIYALWVRSHTDLPLKTYQIVNTFRYETKMTKAFIRVREIHFFESHTCHEDFQGAEAQIEENLAIANEFMKTLCLPILISKRPDWDKFAGAYYSIGLDILLPSLKTLQVGSIHQYQDNFSRPFEIKYEGVDGKHHFCHQTTYGMSERLLGALIGIHGDEKGIKLPSMIAPIQIVIIPILYKGSEDKINDACNQAKERLEKLGYRCHIDCRDKTPGNKFYDWEIKGVPLRIEIGPRDLKEHMVTLVTRDGHKHQVHEEDIHSVSDELKDYDNRLYETASRFLTKHLSSTAVSSKDEGIIQVPWCGKEQCGKELEDKYDMKSLGIPIPVQTCHEPCLICDAEGKDWLRLAKMY